MIHQSSLPGEYFGKTRRAALVIMLLCFTPLLLLSQAVIIKGKVYDGDSRERLPGVKVILDNSGGGISNDQGEYVLRTVAGEHTLKASFSGYEDLEITVEVGTEDITVVDLPMQFVSKSMGPVVISASQYQKKLEEETVSVDVIDKNLIKNNNLTELGEVADKSVGTQFVDGQVMIRGGTTWSYGVGSRTAVMVDNVSFTSGDLGEGQFKQAPLENVEQVEIIKGASSVVYGSSALNGVVNAITAWPTDKPSTEINVFQGVTASLPKNKRYIQWWDVPPTFSGATVSHRQKFGDFDLIAGGNLNIVNSFIQDADEARGRVNFKFRHRNPNIKGLSYGINGNFMAENSRRFFLPPLDIDTNSLEIVSPDTVSYQTGDGSDDRYLRTNIDPHFTYLSEKGVKHRVLGRYMNVYRIGNGETISASSNKYSIDYQFQKRWRKQFALTAGIPISYSSNVSNLYPGRRVTSSGAGYVQGEYTHKRFSVVAGGRYEYNKVDSFVEYTKPVFRSGLNVKATKSTFVRASWGQAYRLPSVGERFIEETFSILNIFPNPQLKPEYGWGAEIGVKQAIKINKWMGFIDLSTYLNEYSDFVEYRLGVYNPDSVPITGPDVIVEWLGLKPFNVSQARIWGFEGSIMGTGKIGQFEVRTLMGYTYHYPGNLGTDTSQRDWGVFFKNAFRGITNRDDIDIDRDQALVWQDTTSILSFRNKHLLKGDLEVIYKKFSVGGTFVYSSFPEKIEPMFLMVIPSLVDYIEEHRKGDLILGLRFAWQINPKLRTSLLIKNLGNRVYGIRPGKPESPRSYTLALRYNF